MNHQPTPLSRTFRRAASLAACLATLFLAVSVRAQTPPVDALGIFTLNSGQSTYHGYSPATYNPATPISLFVWMHGCGGDPYWDLYGIAAHPDTRANQSYVAISIGGRSGLCWRPGTDDPKVLAAIEHVSTYFNINPRKIYLGGYSSGGDMTYRVGFENAEKFAGLLAVNSDPFRDTGSNGPALMSAAKWKINVAHLAHTEDMTYPIATVRASINALRSNGFPATLIERPGGHWVNGNTVAEQGTQYNTRTLLLPYLDQGWVSPLPLRPAIKGKKSLQTSGSRIVLKGTAKDADYVEYKVMGKKYRKAKGSASRWKAPVRLDPGRNVVRVRAVGLYKKSKVLRIVVRRTVRGS